jgi:hypothetical protein
MEEERDVTKLHSVMEVASSSGLGMWWQLREKLHVDLGSAWGEPNLVHS